MIVYFESQYYRREEVGLIEEKLPTKEGEADILTATYVYDNGCPKLWVIVV